MTTTTAPAGASDLAPAPAPLLPVAGPSQRAGAPAGAPPRAPTAPPAIHLRELRKVYTVHEREAGVLASMRSLVRRRSRDIAAVDGVSFDVQPGEVVGFLGPNGAGKTTTLKMLSGLLYPSGGEVRVLDHDPWRRERAYLRQITLVMGNRNQLVWDIPAADSFELNRAIYRIPVPQYRATLDELVDLLDLGALLQKPVRSLSLGERMKCEVAAALLHQPRVLFLDEPTIGLDVTMQRRIRHFIGEYNRRREATVLLTSHYMADVEALCKRVLVIHHGRLLFDGPLSGLVQRFSAHKTIVVELDEEAGEIDLSPFGEVVAQEEGRVTLRVPKAATAQVTGRLLASVPIADLTVADPPIEEVIEQVFARANDDPEGAPGGPPGPREPGRDPRPESASDAGAGEAGP
ncbi:MAG TPA: ATP-binding cassette domain-containing protein [Chloroflexota bacterium]|nr:ATP-binding cassette domain-containing protein [Chloroflexota bacterium]